MSDTLEHTPQQHDESLEIPFLKAEHVRGPLPRDAAIILALCSVCIPVETARGPTIPALPGILFMLKEIRQVVGHGLNDLKERLVAIEEQQNQMAAALAEVRGLTLLQRDQQEWYSPVEVGEILGRKPYTVREWCRLGRVNAEKRLSGRGDAQEWEISHEEVERIKSHGLLPIPAKY